MKRFFFLACFIVLGLSAIGVVVFQLIGAKTASSVCFALFVLAVTPLWVPIFLDAARRRGLQAPDRVERLTLWALAACLIVASLAIVAFLILSWAFPEDQPGVKTARSVLFWVQLASWAPPAIFWTRRKRA